tara:strand:- start:171 stop:1097 length:927 start_codon:yes stop_codon:yes gene_type:complete
MNGRNRRRKDVPFNPFAQNAAAERNRRHAEKAKEKRRLESQNQGVTISNNVNSKIPGKTLEDLQREAREKLAAEGNTSELTTPNEQITAPVKEEVKTVEVKKETPTITQTTAAKPVISNKQTRDERLAELKRKSQQSKDNAKLNITPAKKEVEVKAETKINDDELDSDLVIDELDDVLLSSTAEDMPSKNLNVFKTIQTVDKSSAGISKKKRKSRRVDKKGGGRQKLEKKLKSNKILEFKYVAREILSHPDVPEEHRSNVLGQIIAKGERISIDAAIEFIDQKNLELVLTDEISDKLKSEIKSITTRR